MSVTDVHCNNTLEKQDYINIYTIAWALGTTLFSLYETEIKYGEHLMKLWWQGFI